MAIQPIIGGLYLPPPFAGFNGGSPSFSVLTLDGTGDRLAVIFQAPKTGNIAAIGFVTRTVIIGDLVDVRLETVDVASPGNPSGTLVAVNANGILTVLSTDDNKYLEQAFTAACPVVQGTPLYAAVLSAATFAGSGNIDIAYLAGADTANTFHLPYTRQNASGSYTEQSLRPLCLVIKYDDGTYAHIGGGHYPVKALNTVTFNSGSTPNTRGLKFTMPFTTRVRGIWMAVNFTTNAAMVDVILYDALDNIIDTITLDTDQVGVTSGSRVHRLIWPAVHTLTTGAVYRAVFVPSGSNFALLDFDVDSAALMDAFEGGQAFHYTQRTGAGAWTDTMSKRPWMGLILDGFDDGVQARAAQLINGGMVR